MLPKKTPKMPNFFFYDFSGLHQPKKELGKPDAAIVSAAIPIEEMDEAEAAEFAEQMKRAFIEHWQLKKFPLKRTNGI